MRVGGSFELPVALVGLSDFKSQRSVMLSLRPGTGGQVPGHCGTVKGARIFLGDVSCDNPFRKTSVINDHSARSVFVIWLC